MPSLAHAIDLPDIDLDIAPDDPPTRQLRKPAPGMPVPGRKYTAAELDAAMGPRATQPVKRRTW